jgi:hypothetical protein
MSLQALSRRRSATGPGRQDQTAAPPHLWQNLSSENASTDRPDTGGAGTRPLLIQLAATPTQCCGNQLTDACVTAGGFNACERPSTAARIRFLRSSASLMPVLIDVGRE